MQAVVINNKLYCGGGVSRKGKTDDESYTVFVYDTATLWKPLTKYNCKSFTMVAAKNELLLVGGIMSNPPNTISNALGVWNNKYWHYPYTELPTARYVASVVTYKNLLFVAGGVIITDPVTMTNIIEILHLDNKTWQKVDTKLKVFAAMKSTIIKNIWYLLGGFSTTKSIEATYEIVINEDAYKNAENNIVCIKVLRGPGFDDSSPLCIEDCLYAVGGYTRGEQTQYAASKSIKRFNPHSNKWKEVENLPIETYDLATTVVSNQVIVIGGYVRTAKLSNIMYYGKCK